VISNLASTTTVRLLTAHDIPQALELSSGAGWNQTSEDWRTLIELEPESCFAMECDRQLAATATLVCYGARLAWLGMVLTRADFQRRGFARLLAGKALELAEARRIETVKLDATSQGQPLYEDFGFVPEQEIQRWSCSGPKLSPEFGDPPESACEMRKLDWDAFPAERHRLVASLARRGKPLFDGKGYVMRRDGLRASYLGPCVARTQDSARRLIATALAAEKGPWLWDLIPGNRGAAALAASFGFRPERKLIRMSRGARFGGDDSIVYAIAGFEFG
jgi:GNAT superfamily N-acetyltransferase